MGAKPKYGINIYHKQTKKKRKKSNPIAKALKFFTPKIVRDKTKYRRKEKHDIRNWSLW